MKDVHRAAPHMGINEGDVRQIASGPKLSRRQPRHNVWVIVVQIGDVTEVLRTKITLVVFCPAQG